jgi:hypothetical protein
MRLVAIKALRSPSVKSPESIFFNNVQRPDRKVK